MSGTKKRVAPSTQLTLAECKRRDWLPCKAEHWQATPHSSLRPGVRRDLFGFVDVVALSPLGIVGIQATTQNLIAARIRKIRNTPTIREAARRWVASGGVVLVWGWYRPEGAPERSRWLLDERKLRRTFFQ